MSDRIRIVGRTYTMLDCRECGCLCAGCIDRRRILNNLVDIPQRTIGCNCGAPKVLIEALEQS